MCFIKGLETIGFKKLLPKLKEKKEIRENKNIDYIKFEIPLDHSKRQAN